MILMDVINNFLKDLKKRDVLLLLLAILVLNRGTTYLSTDYISPFPFYKILDQNGVEIGITKQTYFFLICGHALSIGFWHYCLKKEPARAWLFYRYKIIEWLSLLDFFLIYEQSFLSLGFYNVEFTDFKLLAYFYFYILWSSKK